MQMTEAAPVGVKSIIVKGYSLLTIRLWFYSLAFIHVVVLAKVTLSIDLMVDDDPSVRAYSRLRWYLLTCWFNFADITFWVLYTMVPDSIATAKVFSYLPKWAQHSLHTVSLVFVIVDLVLTPRQRPRSHKHSLVVLNGFIIMYTVLMYVNYVRGEVMYAFLATSSRTVCIMSFVGSLCLANLCYYAQWFIISYVWRRKYIKISEEVKLK